MLFRSKIEQLKNQPIVTEAPEVSLQEEYRKIKAEANRLGSIVEAAKEQKNIPAYNAALKKLEQLDAAQSQIIKLAKEQNIILDVDSELAKAKAAADRYMNKDKPVPDALANSLQTLQTEKQRQLQQQAGTLDKTFDPTLQQDLFNIPRQQAEDAQARKERVEEMEAGYVGEQPPVTLTPEPQFIAQQKLEAQDRARAQKEAEKQRKQKEENFTRFQETIGPAAEPKIAAERTAAYKERLANQLDALGLEQGTQQAQQILSNPLKAAILGTGKVSLGAAKQYNELDSALNNQQITPQVASAFGIKVPDNKSLDLKNADDAETALPILKSKIDSLESFRKRVFPSKNLVEKGHLTPAGNRFVRMEATLYELKELQNAAARTLQQTPAEEKLLRAPLGKEVDEAAEQKRVQNAQATANKNAEVRKNALFDFGNLIELLRQGKSAETIRGKDAYTNEGQALIEKILGAVQTEVSARRDSLGLPPAESQQKAAVNKLRKALNTLLVKAKPKAEGVMQGAVRKQIADIDAQISAAVQKGATQDQIRPLLEQERKLRQMLGGAIERGMTKTGGPGELSKAIKERNASELAKLQAGVDAIVENLVGKKEIARSKKQIGPFGLAQESFSQAQQRAEQNDARIQALNKVEAALVEPIMAPEVRQSLKDAKDFLEENVSRQTGSIQKVTAEAFELADRVVMGREADATDLKNALADAKQYVGEGAKQKEMFPETRATERTTPARFERLRKKESFNYKQRLAEENKAERERKSKEEPKQTLEAKLAGQEEILARIKSDVEALNKKATEMRMQVDAEINAIRERGFALNKLSALQKEKLEWMQKAGFDASERIKKVKIGRAHV